MVSIDITLAAIENIELFAQIGSFGDDATHTAKQNLFSSKGVVDLFGLLSGFKTYHRHHRRLQMSIILEHFSIKSKKIVYIQKPFIKMDNSDKSDKTEVNRSILIHLLFVHFLFDGTNDVVSSVVQMFDRVQPCLKMK